MTTFDRFQWQNAWIDDPRIYDELISVLSVLLRYVNFSGICYPSKATIANHLQKSPRTVQRRLMLIEDIGYLEREGSGTVYRARIPSPMTPVQNDTTSPMTENASPMTPVQNDTTSPMTENASPMTTKGDTHVSQTVFEQSNEQLRSSSCKKDSEVLEKPETEKPLPQPPAEILLGFCKQAEIEITIFQAESLWVQVRSQLIDHDEQSVWDYFRWKLSDLTGTEFSTRVKLRFLTQDVSTWLDQQRKRNVGRNDFSAPTATIPNEPAAETEPQASTAPTVSAAAADHAHRVWANALTTMQATVSREPRQKWIIPLKPIGIEASTLHLSAPDEFSALYVDDTYRNHILDALTAAGGEVDAVKFHPEFII